MNSRTGVKRVKSGCITCRIRRVKCDGRACEGYSTLPLSRKDLKTVSRTSSPSAHGETGIVPQIVTDPAFENLLEKRYFQYFRQKSVVSNSSLVETKFWDRLVLQACHAEPAVKHAVLSLSALHQLDQLPRGSDEALQHEFYAERQHQRALTAAQSLISTSSSQPQEFDKILTACVVFVLFESVRGDYAAAAVHLNSGRAILRQHTSRLKQSGRRKDLLEIEHAIARLDLNAVFFVDGSTPYTFTLDDFHDTKPSIIPYEFDDLYDAQSCLVDICRWMLIVAARIDWPEVQNDLQTKAKYEANIARCSENLRRFHDQWLALLSRTPKAPELVVLNITAWYGFVSVVIEANGLETETRYDAFLSGFETIVSAAERIVVDLQGSDVARMFSYEIGYLPPLFFAATRCRDPIMRRRAINVLRDHPRQEGLFESAAAASVAQAWMEAEEAGLDVKCAADVPGERRMTMTEIFAHIQGREAHIELTPGSQKDKKVTVQVEWKEKRT